MIALLVVPFTAGTLRLLELAGGPLFLPASPRLAGAPIPVFVHILGAVTYGLLGAFQFSTALRRRHARWHRTAGKVVVISGLGVALSGLWLTTFLARQPGTGDLAVLFRLTFGVALAAALLRGFAAIRNRDVRSHQAWMIRAYAIALAAGTQTFTLAIGPAIFGAGTLTKDLSLGSAWLLNLAVAEVVIRHQPRPVAAPLTVAASSS